jgi:hypothetical protein
MRQSTFPRSGVLILAPTSIRSLLPSTLISQVESLLESHRIDDAVNLADQQRRKIWGKGQANGDEVCIGAVSVLQIIFGCIELNSCRTTNCVMFTNDWGFNASWRPYSRTLGTTSLLGN